MIKNGDGFNWIIFKKIVIVATLLGVFLEVTGRLIKKSLGFF